ncbi:hypothetical protein ACIOG8_23300 [Streptomyces erythrochromogenes]|uniref:hypothetical protein n=1 Tax=Streptomyces erythrochromogenes TaxID=285574 RepID=UPI0038187D73
MDEDWEVRSDSERTKWTLDPFVGVGPLRFGMKPIEVSEVLGALTEEPQQLVVRHLQDGRQIGEIGRYWRFGLRLFYDPQGRLEGISFDGAIGPQVLIDGVTLSGRVPSELERWMIDRANATYADDDFELWHMGRGIPGSSSLGLVINVQRVADYLVTRPVVFAEHVLDDPSNILPQEAWNITA